MDLQMEAAGMVPVTLTINGTVHSLEVHALTTLLITLREHLGLNGTKIGCGHGQCGACTVLIDGQRRLSCLTFAASVHGKSVTSIEGLADGPNLHPVQQAFLRHEGFQCGYCTPGQILSATGLLRNCGRLGREPVPPSLGAVPRAARPLLSEPCGRTRSAVAEAMSGNICRCGAYEQIVSAVLEAMELEDAHA